MNGPACYWIGGALLVLAAWGLYAWPRWWVRQARKLSTRRRLRQIAAWRALSRSVAG